MKYSIISILSASLVVCSCAAGQETMDELKERVFEVAACQVKVTDARLSDTALPRSIKDGEAYDSDYKWWCSGFFPGTAWYVYEVTGDESVKEIAMKNTLKLADIPATVDNHDIGFMLWCSYGNALRITGDGSCLPVIKAGARKLATRFRPGAGIIQSWGPAPQKDWICPVIIDNMMNLELLEEASKLFAEPVLDSIARTHANTTINNHFRENYSTYHVVDYDPESGAIRHKNTKQGYADESSWGRGQAWALYGYTMMFRETRDSVYLEQAMKVSDFCISKLPEDGITYWDFDAPDIPDALRDASAAAIMASGLAELSTFAPCREKASVYKATAEKIIRELASERYMAAPGENFGFLLKHSVGNMPDNSEVDVPLTYADYYFLEAVIRFCNIQPAK